MASSANRSGAALSYRMAAHRTGSVLNTRLLIAVFLCGIFEGAARKWLLPGDFPELSYAAYLSKFIAFWFICAATAVTTPPSRAQSEFRGFLQAGLALLFCGALLSAFSGFSLAGAVLTIVMVIAGPILAYLSAPRVERADLSTVLRWVAVMSLFPAVLGLLQFELPVNHVLNKYVGDTSWTAVVTDLGRVRATGTFSFISGMTVMTVVCVWAGLSLRSLSESRRDQMLGLVSVAAGFICGLAALSRAAIFMAIALLAVRLLLIGRDRQILVLVLIGALGFGYLKLDRPTTRAELDVSLTSAVFVRHSRADSVLDRLGSWGWQLSDASGSVPLGSGFGVNQIGGRAVDAGHRMLVSYEAELARLVAEVGVLGVIGVLAIRIGLLISLFHAWRSMAPSPVREALLLSMATLCLFFVSNTAFNHVAAGFVWPIAAIALAWSASGPRPPRVR